MRVLPVSRRDQQPGEWKAEVPQEVRRGRLIEKYKGCEIREWFAEWDAADGGVYVGRGNAEMTCSVFQESYKESLDPQMVGAALDGRPLYVMRREADAAQEIIDRFGIDPTRSIGYEGDMEDIVKRCLSGRVSVSLAGVVLKTILLHRPGHLGNLLRLLPCCARKHFRQTPVELLPICLPAATPEEKTAWRLLSRHGQATEEEKHQLFQEAEEACKKAGLASWVWILVALTNYLFCGGNRPLGKVMPHPEKRTQEQELVIEHYTRLCKLWIQDDAFHIEPGNWERQSQDLGEMYTGYEVKKAYKLSWRAIEPHVPKEGAGRISLAETVRPELRPYVQDPSLLRIPDQELGHAPKSAPVLVESDKEYDLIVENLVKSGMLERERQEETLRVNGEPIYNGLFGVHKAWKVLEDGSCMRTLRLIVNLIPSNACQKRMPVKPSQHMGFAPLWGSMCLLEGEVILCYGEDIRHCFHIFSPSEKWRGYFVLSKEASGLCFNDGNNSVRARPRVRSAPMGWSNIVDFAQSTLEEMGKLSGIPPERVVKLGEPSPLMPLGERREYHSYYVDNYDGFCIMAESEAGLYVGKPSDSQLRLRETFKVWGVERDEKKAAEGVMEWSTLGAEQLGAEGLVGSSRKFRRAILGATLQMLGHVTQVRTNDLELASIVGKHMHSVQYCRPLGCCFDEIYAAMNQNSGRKCIGTPAIEELCLLCGLLPFHWMDQRARLNPGVFATDASNEGGGACVSTQLSARGRAKCRLLCAEKDGNEGGAADPLVVVEAFGGIGGLRKALELIGVIPQGIVLIECDPVCIKLAKRHCAYVIVVDDVKKVNLEMVKGWRSHFLKALKVLIGGGWPCVNHSALNKQRQGSEAKSSLLLNDMLAVTELLLVCSEKLRPPSWDVVELYENVVMDQPDLVAQSQRIGMLPIMNEAADVLWCRRPRLFWLRNLPLIKADDLQVVEKQQVGELSTKLDVVKLKVEKPPLKSFLRPNCTKMEKPNEPFFCFARPHPRAEPPSQPAGVERCTSKALGRWKGDSYRLAPYQYQESNLVRAPEGPRRLLADEQLRMLGYNSDHLDLKQKLNEDQRQQLIGNSFPVVVVARLLAGLLLTERQAQGRNLCKEIWTIWATLESRVSQLKSPGWTSRFGLSASGVVGSFRLSSGESEVASYNPRWALDPQAALSDEQLLVYLITRSASHRGTDCKIDAGIPYSASDFCRRSVDPTLWEWKVLMSYKWKTQGHINLLEATAILDLLRKQARTKGALFQRTLLLVDNSTVVGIMTKGRTTSRTLRTPLRRACAVLVSTGQRLILAWVKSEWNPADGPSRWVLRRAVHDA